MQEYQVYLSADEVIEQLGISKATLYSYVSRGLIRSEKVGGKTRNRRYWAEDVLALHKRKEVRRSPERAVERALQWGDPLLESAITRIERGRLYYRGQDVIELATQQSFEEVAALVWGTSLDASTLFVDQPALIELHALLAAIGRHTVGMRMIDLFGMLLPVAVVADPAAFNLSADAVARCGVRILNLFTTITTGGSEGASLASKLAQSWEREGNDCERLINAALILCADHELNVSAFTARCVASAGSTPYAVVNAGLSALQGYRHGGHTERVEALFNEVEANPARAIFERLQRGETISGFGHPLYPTGDPRAKLLLELTAQHIPQSDSLAVANVIADSVFKSNGLLPNLDFGLVTLARSLHLPTGTPLTLFALGRTVGWIGHAIEQYSAQQLIRPRARYVGKL